MPPSNLQAEVLGLIAANRTPESHVAGGIAINLTSPRLSADIDIFHDPGVSVEAIAREDARVLREAGMEVEWKLEHTTMYSAYVRKGDDVTGLDWAQDSAWRFYPAQQHPQLGWVLHPIDLATNKALAAASRRMPRDAFDLVEIDANMLPLSVVMWAAPAKDPGFSPEFLIGMIRRFARYVDDELGELRLLTPITARELSQRLRAGLERAEAFVERMPSRYAGQIFLEGGKIVEPDVDRLESYERREASSAGVWPIAFPVV